MAREGSGDSRAARDAERLASESVDVAVVGGGIIGLAAAWRIASRGIRVALLERHEIATGASHRNAGQIRAGECIPLASPGAVREAVGSLYKRHAPVRVLAPPTPSLLRWLWRFAGAAREPLAPRQRALADLGHLSEDMFDDFARRHGELGTAEPPGALDVYETRGGMVAAKTVENVIRSNGFRCELLGTDEARAVEPMLSERVAGALWFPADRCVDPEQFARALSREAQRAGAELSTHHRVERILVSEGRAHGLVVEGQVLNARTIVLACGYATGALTRPLGLALPIRPGKGYTVDIVGSTGLRVPVVFAERHAAATPLDGRVRLAGGMIVGARNPTVPRGAAKALKQSVGEVLPGLRELAAGHPWAGLRPLTPDGLPVVGSFTRLPNLVLSSGHGMLGITYALGTAELVARLCAGGDGDAAVVAFSPDRFLTPRRTSTRRGQ